MNEIWKKRARMALRGFEILLAVTLLAVLVELVLVMVNAPGPVPEIRFMRRSAPPPETAAPTHLVAVELPHVPVPPVQEKPVVAAPPVRHPAPPVLLDFENLRRLLGGAKAPAVNQAASTGGPSAAGGNQGSSSPAMQLVAVTPMVLLGTNALPVTNAPPATNNVPPAERPKETNRVDNTSSNTSTNSVSTNNNSPVFRISVP